MGELWYFIFEVKFYEEETCEKKSERGIICADNKINIMKRLEDWYGDCIYDVHIYDVDMDTNEILFERNFPGLIEMMENPVEG